MTGDMTPISRGVIAFSVGTIFFFLFVTLASNVCANDAISAMSRGPSHAQQQSQRRTCSDHEAPLVNRSIASFVKSHTDRARSTLLAAVLVPFVLVLLIEREILAAAGRSEQRLFLAFALALLLLVVLVATLRLRSYAV